MTKPSTDTLRPYRCPCGKLLFKGLLLDSTIQIKCKKCGELVSFQGAGDSPELDDRFSIMIDKHGSVVSASSNIQKLFGYKLSELFSMNYGQLIKATTSDVVTRNVKKLWALTHKERYFYTSRVTHLTKTGLAVAGIAQSKFITTPDGTYMFSTFRTGLAPADGAPEPEFSSLREYPFFLQISPEGICLDASSARRRPYQRRRSEVIGRPLTSFMRESVAVRQSFANKLLRHKAFELNGVTFERSDGSSITHDILLSPNFDEAGSCTDYVVYVFDPALLSDHERQFALKPSVSYN